MGQLALGFRSLLYKLAIFFLLAMLLAWVLGGTLWPRAETVDYPAVIFAGDRWHMQLAVGGEHPGEARWRLIRTDDDDEIIVAGQWADAAPRLIPTHNALYTAVRTNNQPDTPWELLRIDGDSTTRLKELPDRLEVEKQLARLQAQQSPDTLDQSDDSTDSQ